MCGHRCQLCQGAEAEGRNAAKPGNDDPSCNCRSRLRKKRAFETRWRFFGRQLSFRSHKERFRHKRWRKFCSAATLLRSELAGATVSSSKGTSTYIGRWGATERWATHGDFPESQIQTRTDTCRRPPRRAVSTKNGVLVYTTRRGGRAVYTQNGVSVYTTGEVYTTPRPDFCLSGSDYSQEDPTPRFPPRTTMGGNTTQVFVGITKHALVKLKPRIEALSEATETHWKPSVANFAAAP